jgi:hypothetical protein
VFQVYRSIIPTVSLFLGRRLYDSRPISATSDNEAYVSRGRLSLLRSFRRLLRSVPRSCASYLPAR